MRLTQGAAPHIRSPITTKRLMGDVMLALLPALAVGVWQHGGYVLWIAAVCMSTAATVQWLCTGTKTLPDSATALTGLLLAMTLPPRTPLWLAALGGAFAVAVGKLLWGGLGQNIFNPALVARAAMMLVFPRAMTDYTAADTSTYATPLHHMALHGLPQESVWDLALGRCGGSVGEVSALALLLGGGYLLWRRVITWHIPFSFLAAVAALTLVFFRGDEPLLWMLSQLFSGGLMLAAFFMATDYATSPVTPWGRLIFGIGCGALTVLFRYVGIFPEGVTYAILLMNGFAPIIERCTPPRRFGAQKGAKA